MKQHKTSGSSTTLVNWRRKILFYEFIFLEFLAIKIDFFYKLLMKWRKPVFLKEIKMAKVTLLSLQLIIIKERICLEKNTLNGRIFLIK